MKRYQLAKVFFNLLFLSATQVEVEATFRYKASHQSLEIYLDTRLLLRHTEELPAIDVGQGNATYKYHEGNFDIKQTIRKRIPLLVATVQDDPSADGQSPNTFRVQFSNDRSTNSITLLFSGDGDQNTITVVSIKPEGSYNRLWLRLYADEDEHVYGGGEQFSYFSLRGQAYPMWVREQGVGRNKSTTVTKLADFMSGAGGDYYTTYWPQPTFVSDRLYYAHLEYYSYSVLNFSSTQHLELELWDDISKTKLIFGTGSSWPQLIEKLTGFFGRQPTLPEWIYNGAIIGLQGGTEQALTRYRQLKSQGIKIGAIWIQDWSGKMVTSFGKRVYWNWMWDPEWYPRLDAIMKQFKEEENVRFLSYINPHVVNGSKMFEYGDKHGYFIKSSETGTTQLVEFGKKLFCASVDFTNPEAYNWYKGVVQDMRKLGFSGWMADFGGEYLPPDDAVYHDSSRSVAEMHNAYSEIWAKLNREAIEEMGLMSDTFIFMRSGFGKSPGHTTASWAGDQNVDFSYADGIASVIPAALSLGMSGMGIHHSDIGGYTSFFCMVRTEEMILRWAEMNVFTPIMRTHEGNRPDRNWQLYTSKHTAKAFGRLTEIFIKLAPYHKSVISENANHGYPAQRPIFFQYPSDSVAYDVKYQYIYGPDLLVAPVYLEGQRTQSVYLPADHWVYIWNGTEIPVAPNSVGNGKYVEVYAEIGNPPVFYRKSSKWLNLFQDLKKYAVEEPVHSESLSWKLLLHHPKIFFYLLLRKIFWYFLFDD